MPKDSTIPWHRVVNSQGKIAFAQGSAQYQTQREKLLSEGVTFNNQRINMAKHRWQ
jgi:methylated-DNA-protein-cysteine methyltransferase-like protein